MWLKQYSIPETSRVAVGLIRAVAETLAISEITPRLGGIIRAINKAVSIAESLLNPTDVSDEAQQRTARTTDKSRTVRTDDRTKTVRGEE